MSSEVPTYIGFEEYSEHIPASIPAAVQHATSRFVDGRSARVEKIPQWEALRQIASDIRLHTIENLGYYLTQLEAAVQSAGGRVHWAETAEDACQTVIQIARENHVEMGDWIPKAPYPLSCWTITRPLPSFSSHFRKWWNKEHLTKGTDSSQ
jgi:hypothetical protein